MSDIHVADIGTVFEVTVTDSGAVVDLSAAAPIQILFRRPDGTRVIKTAALSTGGTDGKMRYTSASGDLNQPGRWHLQGVVTTGAGTWHTNFHEFYVAHNL